MNYFDFFWKFDRLAGLHPEDEYLKIMPRVLKDDVMKYLFEDIYTLFRSFLMKKDFEGSLFYYELAFEFIPRYFKDEVISMRG